MGYNELNRDGVPENIQSFIEDYVEARLNSLKDSDVKVHDEISNSVKDIFKVLKQMGEAQKEHNESDDKRFKEITDTLLEIKPFLEDDKKRKERWDIHMDDLALLISFAKWVSAIGGGVVGLIVAWKVLKVYIVEFVRYIFL